MYQRGEVWWADLDPTVGREMKKIRPVVVISRDDMGRLPLKIVVPMTTWQDIFEQWPWMVKIAAAPGNGLDRTVGADTFQVRSIYIERFESKRGVLSDADVAAVTEALVRVVGWESASGAA